MDIIDIMLAKAMTPQGKTEAYVAKANRAAQKASQAEAAAAAAIATVEAAADEIAAAQSEATDLLADARETLETVQQAQLNNELDVEGVDDEIKKMTVNTAVIDGTTAKTVQVVTTYPDNTLNTQNVTKLYKNTGTNEDGTMTQKAISDVLNGKIDSSTLNSYATKQYVNNAIEQIPAISGEGGNVNLGVANAGKAVVVGRDGRVAVSDITEQDLVNLLFTSDIYSGNNTLGIEIDYDNKTFTRLQGAADKTMGSDFNTFSMYGGRRRCNVADNGTINAFYGEEEYTEDGSNGQVMVYQPKFYYQRITLRNSRLTRGTVINKERLYLSDKEQSGFKLHPLFINSEGEELEYVLIPAYEGSLANNKLQSIAGVQPASYLNPLSGEAAANARGTGWHMTTMQVESALQMLQMVEYGSLNSQASLARGICDLERVESNISCKTGSTSTLGNASGEAESSTSINNGEETTYSVSGKRAISYRGTENPWGNIWHTIGNMLIHGEGGAGGGIPYICTNYNYSSNLTSDYVSVGFTMPGSTGWISAMAQCPDEFDWIFLPMECASNANSAAPVGDNIWVLNYLYGTKMIAVGGNWRHGDSEGMLFYACDQDSNAQLYSFGASIMYIPIINTIYENNITKWTQEMGWQA